MLSYKDILVASKVPTRQPVMPNIKAEISNSTYSCPVTYNVIYETKLTFKVRVSLDSTAVERSKDLVAFIQKTSAHKIHNALYGEVIRALTPAIPRARVNDPETAKAIQKAIDLMEGDYDTSNEM